MASFEMRDGKCRAQLCVKGIRESRTFDTKPEAKAWASVREAELRGDRLPDHTLDEAMERYAKEVSPTKRGARWERIRFTALRRHPIAKRVIHTITTDDMGKWRDERRAQVGASTVYREMTLFRGVFETARTEWKWIKANPMDGIRWPKQPPSRKRRIADDEIEQLVFAFGLDEGLTAETAMNRVGLAFLFAIETAMRAGEIVGMRRAEVHDTWVRLPRTKNGDVRDVPLSPRAREILALLDGDPVFGLNPQSRDTLFRKARKAAGIADLRFHDARAEAIWRLSKKLDVLELARVIGHRDLKSLLIYYQTSAAELADRL